MKTEVKSPLLRKSIIGFGAAVARLPALVGAALCVDHGYNPLIMADAGRALMRQAGAH